MTRSAALGQVLRARVLGSAAAAVITVASVSAAHAGSNPVVSIDIGSATGAPGQVVHVPVTLHFLTTPPASVIATSNDIIYEPSAPILPRALGQGPACSVNPAINKNATAFSFIPTGCEGGGCTGVDALVVSGSNRDPIPDGAMLYTCAITIAPDAAPGTYTLESCSPSALDSNDQQLEGTGTNGTVTVTQRPLACVGDCNGDGEVKINELVVGVNIDLGLDKMDACPAFDRDGNGAVDVNELIAGVNGSLAGCLPDSAVCERAAAAGLSGCVEQVNEAERNCYLESGAACAPDDTAISAALDALEDGVLAACPDAAAVQAVGYGPSFTPAGLVSRLQAACRAEPAALAARSFGGPQGAGLATGTAQAIACLTATHQAGTRLLRDELALYSNCVIDARAGDSCDPAQVDAQAAALQQQLAADVTGACGPGALQGLVAVDESAYAARAAAQVRCLTATAHPDPSPLALDCGPRDSLVDTPRGEYVQVVLDAAVYGTRCGNGSPFAFWVRLAPEGAPVENVVVGMQGGGVCIFNDDCKTRPADLFEALTDEPETGGPLSNDPAISPFAAWTKVYLPYCNQDVFIGGGATSNFPDITVHRFGAVNVRAAMRYVRDVIWRELDRTTEDGYRPDKFRALFGGFSAGGFGTIYNYHWVLDDLQWAHTAAYPDAALALDNGKTLGVANLGILLLTDAPPLGWGARNYVAPYCFATNCGVGPVLLAATSPRLEAVPEQQFLILSNQVDATQQATTFFDSIELWINAMRASYCATRELPGVQYYMPAISQSIHVISPRNELYTNRPVDGVLMRDWLAGAFSNPDAVTDRVEEGTLVNDYPPGDDHPGVMPFACPVSN